MKVKFEEQSQQMHVLMTKQLPAAHAAVERAEQELAAERARSAMAAEASTAVLAQEKHRVKQVWSVQRSCLHVAVGCAAFK